MNEYILIHYIIRNGKEHTLRKVEFYSKPDLFRYMYAINDKDLPCKYFKNKRKQDRRVKWLNYFYY